MAQYLFQLEHDKLVELFVHFPPQGFICFSSDGLPVFQTTFDLLTTLDPTVAKHIRRFPLYRFCAGLLRFPTRFLGTTVTEYAPIPVDAAPANVLDMFVEGHGAGQALLILKDIPDGSPLLSDADNAVAAELVSAAQAQGFLRVDGQALAYVPIDFTNIDEYMERFSAARRKNLRRKLKSRKSLDIEILPCGAALFHDSSFLDTLYTLYLAVYNQSDIHFDLLTHNFFRAFLCDPTVEGVVFLYRHAGELVGYNICLVHNGMLIDKYIGLRYPQARELNLYFVSWFVNLEFAMKEGLSCYVAGWTDPEVKAGLGARFTFTSHLVWVRNPVLRRVLSAFRHWFETDRKRIAGKSHA